METVALLATALLLGGMVYFAAGLAPVVFAHLPGSVSGPFIRKVFPVYYLYVLATSAVAGLALLFVRWPDAAAMLVVAAVTVWLRQGLMRQINRWSDAAQAGDAEARVRFNQGHRGSVIVNVVQMVVAVVVLARFV
ncbi:DUF4149 domain-containing protein [Roseomonas sp. CCTCC AB2023176]|uniref:DUF4149 domain-containing protein n=1 Tax=Roseomonas sp. CCTCC AB2023176 TaxID=3342640 RepID=UPI0035DFADF7